jgi:hypothetical protein
VTQDELELRILLRYTAQHQVGGTKAPDDKSAQELDLRDVIRDLTGAEGPELDYQTKFWYQRLVTKPSAGLPVAPLRPGKKGSSYARAFMAGTTAPAWDRISQLQRLLGASSISPVIIHIEGSTVANLNLGTVIGNIQATVNTLQQSDPEIATALAKLVEAVGKDESLGDQRREIIESLNEVAEEAKKPGASRRIARVSILLLGIGSYILTNSANAAQIWQTWSKPILRFFGLPDQ